MSRNVKAAVITIVMCAALVAAFLNTFGVNVFDFREPCANVSVDRSTVNTEIGADGIARKTYVVTITYGKKFGPAFAVTPYGETWRELKVTNNRSKLRLPAGIITLDGSGYGGDCNAVARI